MTLSVCPRCHYQRRPTDTHVMEGVCPACGIAYEKWLNAQQRKRDPSPEAKQVKSPSRFAWTKTILFHTPDRVEPMVMYGRAILFLLFFLWGWYFILGGISWTRIGGSFLHLVILPFHEFGHVLFMPFGRFMSILGGSLFQVLLPLGLAAAFLYRRDTFAASLMLWWCGQSFIDLSPYIADASFRAIPLIAGMGEEAHDWGNLLSELGWLRYDQTLARLSFGFGTILMMVSWIWGAVILWKTWVRNQFSLI